MINCAHDPRMGLQITRYATWPRTRDQSNGEHSAQIMRILLTVWPDCSREILVHAVTHDMGEMAGDVQYPFKKNDAVLKKRMDAAEADVLASMSRAIGVPPAVDLSEFEKRVFKLCEYLEMWEWGLHEVNLGNQYGRTVAQRCMSAASQVRESIIDEQWSAEITEGWPALDQNIRNYMQRRLTWENQS